MHNVVGFERNELGEYVDAAFLENQLTVPSLQVLAHGGFDFTKFKHAVLEY